MVEQSYALIGADGTHECTDFSKKTGNSSLSRLAQQRFESAEELLNRVQIRGILAQIDHPRAHSFDRVRHTSHLVRWKIVDDDDVPAMQCRSQIPFDIGEEGGSVHRAVDH